MGEQAFGAMGKKPFEVQVNGDRVVLGRVVVEPPGGLAVIKQSG